MIDVGIVGGSGYTGGELMRLLANHPEAKVVVVTSRKLSGKPVSSTHPHLRGIYSLNFEAPSAKEIADRCDIVFTAVPHGTAMDWVPELLDAGTKVIDLSSDYRLPVDVFEKTYGTKHRAPRDAVSGMTEQLDVFVAPRDPVKVAMLTLTNRSASTRRMSSGDTSRRSACTRAASAASAARARSSCRTWSAQAW